MPVRGGSAHDPAIAWGHGMAVRAGRLVSARDVAGTWRASGGVDNLGTMRSVVYRADALETLASGPGLVRAEPREARDERRTLRAWAAYIVGRRASEGRRNGSEESRVRVHVENDPIGDLYLEEVTPRAVRDWLGRRLESVNASRGKWEGEREKRPLSRSTLRNALNLLRVILEEAVTAGRLDTNPARGVQIPRYRSRYADRRESKEARALTPGDLEKVLCADMPNDLRVAIVVTLDVGWRFGEMVGARFEDFDLEGGRVTIRGQWEDEPTKSGRVREVRVMAETVRLLGAWMAGRAPKLGSLDGWRPFRGTRWTKKLTALGEALGLGRTLGWHDLRHTSAMGWVEGWWTGEKMLVRDVQKRLGHASVVTTEGYLR
jgi:integrase